MLSVIIPTYNEKGNIGPLIRQLEGSLPPEHEIIIVDDNSPDGTGEEVARLSEEFPSLRLVKRGGKMGLTSAVVAGAQAAAGPDLVVMDADLSHPPQKAAELGSWLRTHELVIGSRNMKGGGVERWPFHRKVISRGAELLAKLVLGVRPSDPLSGFFAVKKEFLLKTRFRTKGYKLLLNILADNPGIRVKEVPYRFRDRHAGRTKLGTLEIANYLFDLVRIKF